MKKELQKNLSFVLFVMAVFFAGMSLTVFQSYVWMSCIAGVILLATTVFYVLSREKDSSSPMEKTSDILLADRMAELMRGNEKAEKGVYIAVKKQHEAMEDGLAALEGKLAELIKAQESAVKTLVMYNKENAKQMALSERDELERLRDEIKRLQHGNGASESMSGVVDAIKEMSHRLYEEIHENNEAMLSELETTVDCLEEMKDIVNGMSEGGAIRVAGNFAVSQPAGVPQQVLVKEEPEVLFATMPETEEPIAEEEPEVPMLEEEVEEASEVPILEEVAEEVPDGDMFASSGVDLSDPNRPLSADDIAALFAQVGTTEEEPVAAAEEPAEEMFVQEEEPAEEKPEDAMASSGVDLSDPNRTLSADDIAALIAAMGN